MWHSGREVFAAANWRVFWFGVAALASGPTAYLMAMALHRLRGTRPLPVAPLELPVSADTKL
jgi:hypothetical protein